MLLGRRFEENMGTLGGVKRMGVTCLGGPSWDACECGWAVNAPGRTERAAVR
jgi:hypothetical protein